MHNHANCTRINETTSNSPREFFFRAYETRLVTGCGFHLFGFCEHFIWWRRTYPRLKKCLVNNYERFSLPFVLVFLSESLLISYHDDGSFWIRRLPNTKAANISIFMLEMIGLLICSTMMIRIRLVFFAVFSFSWGICFVNRRKSKHTGASTCAYLNGFWLMSGRFWRNSRKWCRWLSQDNSNVSVA